MINKIKAPINAARLNLTSALRKIKQGLTMDKSAVAHLKTSVTCPHKWYGSSYGGFYINPDLLSADSIIYSFGIGKDISFDLKCINRHHCQVFGFDPTPKSIEYIRAKKISSHFRFFDFGIAAYKTEHIDFFLPANPRGVSGSLVMNQAVDENRAIRVLVKSFKDITAELGHRHIDVLKMDIEGSEYEVLEAILEAGIRVDQILVEFHDRFFESGPLKSEAIVKKMNSKGFEIFAHSINFEEISFIQRDLVA